MLRKVISGGQTGADRIGLEIAKECGLETGGTAPKNFKTERGSDLTLKDFGLLEHTSERYEPRTEENVKDSDGTVIFGNISSPGSTLTIEYLIKHKKKYITNPTPIKLKEFIVNNNILILNVAGNRASKLTMGEITMFENILRETFNVLLDKKN